MKHVRIPVLLNVAMVAGIGVTLGARAAEQVIPIERQGEVNGNAVVLSITGPSGATDVVLLVDEDGPGQAMDGRVDRGFLLQGAQGLRGDLVVDVTYVRVIWDERAVGVWQAGGELLKLRVTNDLFEDETQIAGFGLSHSTAWDVNIPIKGESTPELLAGLRTDVAAVLGVCDEPFDCRGGGDDTASCGYSCGGERCEVNCRISSQACCGCGSDGKPCCRCRGRR